MSQLLQTGIVAAAAGAGVVIERAIASTNKFRKVWCFFENADFIAGDEAWIRFYLNNAVVSEFPALIKVTAGTFFGFATSNATFLATGSSAIGDDSLFYFNSDPGVGYYVLQPFSVTCEADSVRLEQTKAGTTVKALLACLSTLEAS